MLKPTIWQPGTTLEQIMVLAIRDALIHHEGNKMRAAKDLRISLRSVRNWVRRQELLKEFRQERPEHLARWYANGKVIRPKGDER